MIEQYIEQLIDQASAQQIIRFNRYGVGAFDVDAATLPQGLVFERLGLCDVTILNGNGCAQIRKRKQGPTTITFNIDPEVHYEG